MARVEEAADAQELARHGDGVAQRADLAARIAVQVTATSVDA